MSLTKENDTFKHKLFDWIHQGLQNKDKEAFMKIVD